MSGPLRVTPPELRGFAHRVDGYAGSAGRCDPAATFSDVGGSVPGGLVASIAGALGERLGRSVNDIRDGLDGLTNTTREAMDVIVHTDADNAATMGRR